MDKILRRWGYSLVNFEAMGDSLLKLIKTAYPAGATFKPNILTFVNLKYVHEIWAIIDIPQRFLGFEGSDEDESEDAASSTMVWEVQTLPDEPQRRLLPHELDEDPVFKNIVPVIRAHVRAHDDDDAISCDSHITGVEDPEEYVKASVARGDYMPSRTWLKGMERWAQRASEVVKDQVLVNDEQINEAYSREQPRVATSLDLDKPDYLSMSNHDGTDSITRPFAFQDPGELFLATKSQNRCSICRAPAHSKLGRSQEQRSGQAAHWIGASEKTAREVVR